MYFVKYQLSCLSWNQEQSSFQEVLLFFLLLCFVCMYVMYVYVCIGSEADVARS